MPGALHPTHPTPLPQIEQAQGCEDEEARGALAQLKSQTAVLSTLNGEPAGNSGKELSELEIAAQLAT
jgi:hypothetical protein